eukprot:CAMPEP_0183541616 /NCGR_PEP_ID=MMETSP0371-20130417/39554_1 /TAXON_ID=268820 /ORGANISM="Peridinium aciculiferum, Strain PAER-2" /LENGTH=121 /DNA_ID=CAMNT_0025742727 /DNA_START=22 /DNA_END=384 /DNA_ORIENTATION=-
MAQAKTVAATASRLEATAEVFSRHTAKLCRPECPAATLYNVAAARAARHRGKAQAPTKALVRHGEGNRCTELGMDPRQVKISAPQLAAARPRCRPAPPYSWGRPPPRTSAWRRGPPPENPW